MVDLDAAGVAVACDGGGVAAADAAGSGLGEGGGGDSSGGGGGVWRDAEGFIALPVAGGFVFSGFVFFLINVSKDSLLSISNPGLECSSILPLRKLFRFVSKEFPIVSENFEPGFLIGISVSTIFVV